MHMALSTMATINQTLRGILSGGILSGEFCSLPKINRVYVITVILKIVVATAALHLYLATLMK